jgi:uncharacterized protein (DUF1499 family)
LGLALAAALLAVFGGFGSRWEWWSFRTGFRMLEWAARFALLAALLCLVGAVHGRGRRRGASLALLGLAIALVVVGVPWNWRQTARSVPPIHDISTDTRNPPQFVAILPLRADAPNPPEYGGDSIAVQQRAAYPELGPVAFAAPADTAFRVALDAARKMGWEIVDADRAGGRIEATDRTFWFGFRDDVVIRVAGVGGGSYVDVRSKSRVGGSDVGTNARRVRAYLQRLTDESPDAVISQR